MPSVFNHPDVKVMTYNLKNGGDLEHWERRKAALTGVIRDIQPTLLGVQEAYEFQLAYLRQELQHYEIFGEGREPLLGDEYCAIFVDTHAVNVSATGTFWISPTPEIPGSKMPGGDLPRVATWVHAQVHGTPLLYINTHLTYLEADIPAQMDVLGAELEKLIDPTIETIITGDFNIGRHREPIEVVRSLGFHDAWSISSEVSGPRFTFADWRIWSEPDAEAVSEENRIDWVCIRPADGEAPVAVRVQTLNTHIQEPLPSDHFPVVVGGT